MTRDFWNKRIPTILGILLIVIGVAVTTFLVGRGSLLNINASPSNQPKQVRISNITDSAFTVSFLTDDSVIGSLNYGKSQSLGQTALDEKDQQTVSNRKIHSITVRGLSPQTQYFFTITSGQQTFLNSGQNFNVVTGATITSSPPTQNPISGKIILPSGSAPAEGIIYLTLETSQVISTTVKSDGTYILPLNSLRSSDLANYYPINPDSVLKMLVFGDGLTSSVSFSASEISPVPTVTLSKNYDFTSSSEPVASSSASLDFPSFTSTDSAQQNNSTPQILTPKTDQGFSDQQPTFKGTAPANQSIQIIIHSDSQIESKVTTDAKGNWTYRPSTPLSPGTHTVTIIAKDASGILKTISQSFVVYASGQQINPGVVSGTPTPTQTVTPTLTLTPTVTAAVTTAVSPTDTPTLTPTPTSIVNQTVTPTKTPLPPTGNPSIFTFGIIGILISLAGGLLFILARGSISLL